jgi:hypothetical protein
MTALASLRKNPLPSLADEILAVLPDVIRGNPGGATGRVLSAVLGADILSLRRAMVKLAEDGRADLRRRKATGREWAVVPWRYRDPLADGERYCPTCKEFFKLRPKIRRHHATTYDNRHCCSRKCSVAWSWTRPGVAKKRKAGILLERQTPAGKKRTIEHNRKRWSRPGERKRLSEWNKRRWADPVIKAELSRAIALAQGTPEMRAFYSNMRTELWKDPKFRKRMVDGIKKSKGSPEARKLFSKLLKERWQDPVLRKKYLAGVRRAAKIRGAQMKGKKQSRKHVARRVASRKRSRAARRRDLAA